MTNTPLFAEATDFETLHADLSDKLQEATISIKRILNGHREGDDEASDGGILIKSILEKTIGAFGLAVVLNQDNAEDAEDGWNQPWMYFWNYATILAVLAADDIRLKYESKSLEKLAAAFAAEEPIPEELLPPE